MVMLRLFVTRANCFLLASFFFFASMAQCICFDPLLGGVCEEMNLCSLADHYCLNFFFLGHRVIFLVSGFYAYTHH